MSLPKKPFPLTLNDTKLPDKQFKERLVEFIGDFLQYFDAVLPQIASNQTATSSPGGGPGGTITVPNSVNLSVGEVAHLSGTVGLTRASRTQQPATHIAVAVAGGTVTLASSAATLAVLLDGAGTGNVVYLGLNGRGTCLRPTPTTGGTDWEQVIGVRLDSSAVGLVSVATNIPASVPMKV
jgi:hypothetical protein